MINLKKKLLILTMILFVFMSVASFAADTQIPPLPDYLCRYYVIYNVYGARFVLATSESPFVYKQNENNIVNYGNDYVYMYELWAGESDWTLISGSSNYASSLPECLVASNHHIYYGTREEMGTQVFFSAPSPIRTAMEIMDFGMILRTFSAGLIPLVGLIVLAVSLRKGWDFLRNQLMH